MYVNLYIYTFIHISSKGLRSDSSLPTSSSSLPFMPVSVGLNLGNRILFWPQTFQPIEQPVQLSSPCHLTSALILSSSRADLSSLAFNEYQLKYSAHILREILLLSARA